MDPIRHKRILTVAATALVPLAFAGTAAAASTSDLKNFIRDLSKERHHKHVPAAIGTVAAVSGDMITINGKNGATFAVDAAHAKITKGSMFGSQSIPASDVVVGDNVLVMGSSTSGMIEASRVKDSGQK